MIFLALLALQAWEDVPPNEWVLIDNLKTGTLVYLQAKSFSAASEAPAAVWIKSDRSKDATTKIRSTMTRLRVDCTRQTLQELAFVNYAADGSIAASSNGFENNPVRPVVPDSVGETILAKVCLKK